MAIKDFFRSALKTATSIFLALAALAAFWLGYEKVNNTLEERQALPYEAVKTWSAEGGKALGMNVEARTKLVSGMLMTQVKTDKYPTYLSDPKLFALNHDRLISLVFLDKDGFSLFEKAIAIKEFYTNVNDDGSKHGLQFDFNERLPADSYKRIAKLGLSWTVQTEPLPEEPKLPQPSGEVRDHCAAGINKTERLKRLAQFGRVRETGLNEYTSGLHSVMFGYDGAVLSCS